MTSDGSGSTPFTMSEDRDEPHLDFFPDDYDGNNNNNNRDDVSGGTPTGPGGVDQDDSDNSNDSGHGAHDAEEDVTPCSEDSDDEATAAGRGGGRRRGQKKGGKKRGYQDVPLTEAEAERRRVLANWQERGRMDRLNKALASLRAVLPPELAPAVRRLSKIRTLRLAIAYIRGLGDVLALDDARREAGGYGGVACQQQQQQQQQVSWAQPQQIHPHPYFRHPGHQLYHHHHHHHQQQQHQWPQQQAYLQSTPPSMLVASPNASVVMGDGSFSDQGYYSSSFGSSSLRSDQSSLLAGGSPLPGTPLSTPFPPSPSPYPLRLVKNDSTDEGYSGISTAPGSSFMSSSSAADRSSLLSPDVSSPRWLTSTPTGPLGHFNHGNLRPRTFRTDDDDDVNDQASVNLFDSGRSSSGGAGNAAAATSNPEGRWSRCARPVAPETVPVVSPPSSCRFSSPGAPLNGFSPLTSASRPSAWTPHCPPDSTSL